MDMILIIELISYISLVLN